MFAVAETPALLTEQDIEAVRAELIHTDGEPMESAWHCAAINLMMDVIVWRYWRRTDYYVGGNMFIYYSRQQLRDNKFKGPDFFFVKDVDGTRDRLYWWVFEENGKFPNVIIELLSPTTATEDLTTKKDLYEHTFLTPDYYCYDPESGKLLGWRHDGRKYRPLKATEKGWLWSEELGLYVGEWSGEYQGRQRTWLRFYDERKKLVLTELEMRRKKDARRKG